MRRINKDQVLKSVLNMDALNKTFAIKLIWMVILYNAAMVTCAMKVSYEDVSFKTIFFFKLLFIYKVILLILSWASTIQLC